MDDPGRPMDPADGPERGLRRLTDQEVRVILARASRSDARPALPGNQGLTLEELVDAAREAGMDPLAVRSAANILPMPSPASGALLGGPTTQSFRARLSSSPADLKKDCVELLERTWGRKGSLIEDTPDRFVWRESHGPGRTTATFQSRDHGTDVTLEADRVGHFVGVWFAAFVALAALAAPLGGLGLVSGVMGPLGAALAAVAAPFLLARPVWKRMVAGVRERLEAAAMELALADQQRSQRLPPTGNG